MDTKKVTQEELDQILSFRRAFDDLAFRFGKIEFAIRTLVNEQKAVSDEFTKLGEEEVKFFDQLRETYGEGEINLETGEIVT